MKKKRDALTMFWRILCATVTMPYQGLGALRERMAYLKDELHHLLKALRG